MLRSADNILSVCSLGIAIFLMMPAGGDRPLVLDEHAAYWLSAPDGTLSIWERSVRYAAAPPLASWAQAASMSLLGEREFALRLPSILAFVLAVGVMAFGCRSSLGGLPAALSACALALHPDVVDEVRIGRTYGLVVLWMALLLMMTLKWREPKIGWKDGVLWGLIAAAAVWTHILTIPVVGLSALMLLVWDVRQCRSLRPPTAAGWLLAGLLCLPLVPMGERIWEWRFALNYQTGDVPLHKALGPFVWLGLPLAGGVALIGAGVHRWRGRASVPGAGESRFPGTVSSAMWTSGMWTSAMSTAVVMGLLPLLVLVAAGQGDLSSLAHPRYRVPLAAANACLLGLLCSRLRRPSLCLACLAVSLGVTWTAVGRMPTQLVRLNTPQAPVWKEMAETLERTVKEGHLESAPVFVQSGLIEGTLIPAFPEDIEFHGYVSSRMGRFYARTPNPRYALPMFWGGDNAQLLQFFEQLLSQTAAGTPSDLFVAVATDTDVNRSSFRYFDKLLERYGYKSTLLAGHETWAVLYHYRRSSTATAR